MKVGLDLVEEPPGAFALRREETAPVLQTAMGASRDGAHDVQVGDQGLGAGGVRTHVRAWRLVSDAQDE